MRLDLADYKPVLKRRVIVENSINDAKYGKKLYSKTVQ